MTRWLVQTVAVGCALGVALGVGQGTAQAQAQRDAPWPPLPLSPIACTQVDGVNTQALRSFLAAQDWQAADAETRRLLDPWLHPGGYILGSPQVHRIPPVVLRTLDRLWVTASGGRFGFSVQQRIWAEIQVQTPTDEPAAVRALGDRVGWTRPPGLEDPTFIAGEWLTERELTYSLAAPEGHLPWAGVSWAHISRLLSLESCGSCTIDAMYVQGGRFYQYLPQLYHRVDRVVGLPPAAPTP